MASMFQGTRNVWRRIRTENAGATSVEYGIMVAAVAAVIVAVVFVIGAATDGAFTGTCTSMDAHMNCSP